MKIIVIGNGKMAADCVSIILQNKEYSIAHIFFERDKNPAPYSLLNVIEEYQIPHSEIKKIHDDGNLQILQSIHPDWILNINCFQYLRSSVLSTAQHGVINFHNGPLPLYGGVNISSWPIINGENFHGVTWHMVTAQIDGGDILSQSSFEIGNRWTAAKLMTTCISEGIRLFHENWDKWLSGVQKPTPQQGRATYFSLKNEPPNRGILHWEKPAKVLDQWVRGLTLFPYPNDFGFPKIQLKEAQYIVTSVEVVSSENTACAGSIIAHNEKHFIVQCATEALMIKGLANLDLSPKTIKELIHELEIHENFTLPLIDFPLELG